MITQLLLILQVVEQTNEIVIYSPAEGHLFSSLKHLPTFLWTEGAQWESMTHFIFPLRVISHLLFDVIKFQNKKNDLQLDLKCAYCMVTMERMFHTYMLSEALYP